MHRSSSKRGIEERRVIADVLLRRQRGASLNAKRKQKLFELEEQLGVTHCIPLISNDEELEVAIRNAIHSIRNSVRNSADHVFHLRYLRTLLTDSEEPPFNILRQLQTPALLLEEVESVQSSKEVKLEALWCLAVLADDDIQSTEFVLTRAQVILPFLDGVLGFDLAELAAWICHSLCVAILQEEQLGSLDLATPLTRLFLSCKDSGAQNEYYHIEASLTAAWALCSLVSHSLKHRKRILIYPQFAMNLTSLLTSEHGRIVTEAAWLITYLTASDDDHLEALLAANVVPHLLNVFQMSKGELKTMDCEEIRVVLTPILRGLGNIASGISLSQVMELINYENGMMMDCLHHCLESSHRGLQKEACVCLAKIAAACDDFIIEIMIQFHTLDRIFYFIIHAAPDIKREAAFVLANLCFTRNEANVEFLKSILSKEPRLIGGIVSLMQDVDLDTVSLGLDFTEVILKSIPNGPTLVDEAKGIEALDNLHFSNVPAEIQDFAAELVDTYFGEDYGLG
eukprot:g2174.t1